MSDNSKKNDASSGRGSTVELLAKIFPERSMDDIHVVLEKHGGNIEATAWEMLAERGAPAPCHKTAHGGSYAKELAHAPTH